MRVALLSDTHGNAVGLQAALDDLARHPADLIVHLGDALQGGSQPEEVVDILKGLACPVIMGNADHFVASGETSENLPPGTLEVRQWTRDQIGESGIEYIQTFLPTYEVDLGGGRSLLCFHGSPKSFEDVILPETPDDVLDSFLGPYSARLFTGGHTHLQWSRSLGGSTFVNPGSAGMAYNRHLTPETFYVYPIAEYAIVDASPKQISIEFCRVPFQPDEIERAALSKGKPFADHEGSRFRPQAS